MSPCTELREQLSTSGLIAAPGAYDALTAKIVESVGFQAVYMTGYGTSAARLGLPDLGLVTMNEMLDNLRAIADAVDIPVIADGDTGYGNPLNVIRTVREYEKAGAAAIHIEDQVWPKRCGHMKGKQVIAKAEMVTKLRAAVDHRSRGEFLIIARTDALAVEGWEAALDRGHAYAEAGADLLFVEAPETRTQMEQIPRQFEVPCLINMGPRTPNCSNGELEQMGYAMAIFPAACLVATVQSNLEALTEFRKSGRAPAFKKSLASFHEFNQFLGLARYGELEKKYAVQ